jgi:lipoprotein-anchoring transpeptidase ErfK/SrfK
MGKRMRQSRLMAILLCCVAAFAASAVMPVPAHALSVSADADVLGWVDVKAHLTAADPTGLVVLMVDGTALRTKEATKAAARTFSFPGVRLSPGAHKVQVMLRSRGAVAKSASARVFCWRRPTPAVLLSPRPNGYGAQSVAVMALVGPDTTRLTLRVNGTDKRTIPVQGGWDVSLGIAELAVGDNRIELVASNPVAKTAGSFRVRRLDFPWATCIIVDKSERRIYWVRDGMLVKTYPCAIGKPGTPTPARTWRVGEKLYETMGGVFGPRRLRLYRQNGPSSFSYTGYGIHGTNQEWVIGTMASHGCIRMYNRDISELWPQVPLYTMVQTRE